MANRRQDRLEKKEGPEEISRPLLRWYDREARVLPWRVAPNARGVSVRPDPYRVWLSEVMLQQTTVATVTPRFERFLALFPSVTALASAPVEAVLAEWAGLGYYARARNLHKCAKEVATRGGLFPDTEEDLQSLPGIGPYTAAAIAAIAFDRPSVVMDGNIERVMARLFAVETPLPDAKSALKRLAARLTPKKRPGDYAQALMDLGAMICTPRNPQCEACPLAKLCAGHATGIAGNLPRRKPRAAKPVRYGRVFILARASDGALWLSRRPDKGLLGGMLGLPGSDWAAERPDVEGEFADFVWKILPVPVRHTFTHFHLDLEVHYCRTRRKAPLSDGAWHDATAAQGMPTLFRKALGAHLQFVES